MRTLAVMMAVLLLAQGLMAQTPGIPLSHYLLDSFTKGRVWLRSGEIYEEQLNYNSLTNEMVFLSNGKPMAIAQPETVDSVTFEGRTMILADMKFYERLVSGSQPLYAWYTCTIKEPGSSIGYGMSSSTTAVTPITALIQSGGAYSLRLPSGYTVIPGVSFFVYTSGKYRPANSVKQLVSIFPSKKAFIHQYVSDHSTNFSRKEDMIALVEATEQ